jgi:enoyl-CoA hydratase
VLLEGLNQDAAQAMAVAEASMTRVRATDDFTEGTRAFIEKRAPVWSAS